VTTTQTTWYPDRPQAEAEEGRAILAESPRYNVRAPARDPGTVRALSIRVPRDRYERLRRAAFETRTPINTLVVEGIALRITRKGREEHWEVAVQADPGGIFFTDTDEQAQYPDAASAGEQALKLQGSFHCVRVRHVMTEWHMPDEAAATEGQP
jgi:hypothetical protein